MPFDPSPLLTHSIHYCDDYVIVVDKPAGLLSVPGRGEGGQDSLITRVQTVYSDALSVHRLDMATSGLIIFARGAEMHRALSIAFEKRSINKRYCAVVHGHMMDDCGDISLPLIGDWERRPRQIVDHMNGRSALTRYRVTHRNGEGITATSRVELEPVTGRSHQLRVHLMSIGHAILGDALYAPPESSLHHPRLHLHATSIAFLHPGTHAAVRFDSPCPF
ncbi:MAG: RluA family pseudouridine synthase [Rhodocyclaceae bacterium]|nr:RluA family pseudouridine synthase [Rhodocyclaceae bacterium]